MEELESAKYYHTRSVQAVLEDKNSIARKISFENIKEYHRDKSHFTSTSIDKLLLSQL